MTKFFAAACAALLLHAPTVAFADDAMMAGGHTNLMCKSTASMMYDGKIVGPDLSNARTTDQINTAWQGWISARFPQRRAGDSPRAA